MYFKIKLVLIFVISFCCSGNAQDTVLSKKKLNIFTLGDSNGTFPYSWPQQLKHALPNSQVFNISKSGRTIGFTNLGDSNLNSLLVLNENLKKAAQFTGLRPFDFIIIDLGTNDAKAVFADRQQEVPKNLANLIKEIKNNDHPSIKSAKILIVSPTPYGTKADTTEKYFRGSLRVKKMAKTFEKVAKDNNCYFLNGQEIYGLDIEKMTVDGLHLDATGSKNLIDAIVKIIVQVKD